MSRPSTLIVFSGLPGTGKTTISRALATELSATYLRIDEIEQSLRADALAEEVGAAGYAVAQAIAATNLSLGRTVIADCVNPVKKIRDGWHASANSVGAHLFDVEITCSDRSEHQRRVESRISDIAGLVPPSWAKVTQTRYDPWDRACISLDTAALSPAETVAIIKEYV